ncbi:MAG TPA: hypothetical protein PKA28_09435 [Methylomusa anaerophila]|uniref:Uncharacterized protein n=1 Tax=Methylomusa anaerophila TaxID=1930071 RepID=A0A348AI39_9FIRM|nr:hypothetical protein [Methylomusa anaerophila]BBB90737.1 hypothetical protein MAMMFC1_01398 [Methylomusa anaerophila]HML88660.1 hypothetical protein [Methylomusa anaerophila]
MKKLMALLTIVFAITIFPLAALADDHHGDRDRNQQHPNQAVQQDDRRAQHEKQWRDHEKEWKEHDREWKEHRQDRDWREEHAKMWPDWYKWHKNDENEFHLRLSGDAFEIEIFD